MLDEVATSFDTTVEVIRDSHGTAERRLTAYLAFEEGLIPLRPIARDLGLRSAGGVSHPIRRCRDELARDPITRELLPVGVEPHATTAPPLLFPPKMPMLTARNYHRARSRPRRQV